MSTFSLALAYINKAFKWDALPLLTQEKRISWRLGLVTHTVSMWNELFTFPYCGLRYLIKTILFILDFEY